MRKVISILIILALLMIAGCSNKEVIKHNYTYKGENEFWTAEYNVNGKETHTRNKDKSKYDNDFDKVLTITYKGDLSELNSVKHLEISYSSSSASGKLTEDYDQANRPQKTYTIKSSGKNVSIAPRDEVIGVTINLDGNIEKIKLRNEE